MDSLAGELCSSKKSQLNVQMFKDETRRLIDPTFLSRHALPPPQPRFLKYSEIVRVANSKSMLYRWVGWTYASVRLAHTIGQLGSQHIDGMRTHLVTRPIINTPFPISLLGMIAASLYHIQYLE